MIRSLFELSRSPHTHTNTFLLIGVFKRMRVSRKKTEGWKLNMISGKGVVCVFKPLKILLAEDHVYS